MLGATLPRPNLLHALFASLLPVAACASEDAHFDIRSTPEFKGEGLTLSVFGVFRDGRMSTDAWNDEGAKLSPSLGARMCEAAYGKAGLGSGTVLARTVDDDARENGVTDDLLVRFGPLAKGDAIAVFTTAGEVAHARDAGSPSATPAAPPAWGRRGRRGRSSATAPARGHAADHGSFEMSAQIFSVRLGRSLAVVSMSYAGSRVDEALEKFRGELEKVLPHATCVGWNWDVPLELDGLHSAPDEP
jgi:hypothetical protein